MASWSEDTVDVGHGSSSASADGEFLRCAWIEVNFVGI